MNFIFDFDSTLVKNESLNDVLSLSSGNNKSKVNEIVKITNMAMEGLISPKESMDKRLNLATISKSFVKIIADKTKNEITNNMIDFISFLKKNKINIYIVSGGFFEMIEPTARILGISKNNIFANNFVYNNEIVVGAEKSLLLEDHGKVKMIKSLKEKGILVGKNIMIGDGFTDLETFIMGSVDEFICFCGIVLRENVVKQSRNIARNVDELKKISDSIIKLFN